MKENRLQKFFNEKKKTLKMEKHWFKMVKEWETSLYPSRDRNAKKKVRDAI